MIYDLHTHIAALETGQGQNFCAPPERQRFLFRRFLRRFGIAPMALNQHGVDAAIRRRFLAWVEKSRVDRAVVLALDGAYHQDGSFDRGQTHLRVGNDYAAQVAGCSPKLLWGASIHPYRSDALAELDRVMKMGACLIKWLPSAQNIAPDNPRCFPFYEAMADAHVPLLSHTGNEHALGCFPNSLNDPMRLVPSLKRGVTVIAAHCGARIFLHERCYFKTWSRLALEHENMYGDVSAFVLPTRMLPLRAILRDARLAAKVLYGSDFPVPAMPRSCLLHLGWTRMRRLCRIRNPLDLTLSAMQELGAPADFFSRAESVLRLTQRKVTA